MHRKLLWIFLLSLLASQTSLSRAQGQKSPPPKAASTPQEPSQREQEPVRIFTEEVRLPVSAFDAYGHYDPTVEADEILILEDGVAQQIRSVRHVPANVLLLLDTSNQIGFVKGAGPTRAVALQVVSHLRQDDSVAVIQFSDRVELLQNWSDDKDSTVHVLKTKLFSGRRESLSAAVITAVDKLKERPVGNRHVVLVTDGVETPDRGAKFTEAIKALNAAQATVYVISYTALMRRAIANEGRSVEMQKGSAQPKEANPGGDPTMPPGQTRNPVYKMGGITFGQGRELRRRRREYQEATRRSEQQLGSLAEESGGRIFLPLSVEEMAREGAEVAREIGSQYLVTYRPTRPLASAQPGEYRRVEIASRRVGLYLRTRHGYVVPAP